MRANAFIEAVLGESFQRVAECESRLSAGDEPETIHQVRITVRKLRSELRSFCKILDRAWAQGLRDELGRFDDELSRVRDTDVLFERLQAHVAGLPPFERQRAQAVLDICKQAAADARMRLHAVLQEPWYIELLERMRTERIADRITISPKKRTRRLVRKLIARSERKLRTCVQRCGDDPSDAQLHRVRIHAKRLRYLAESCAPLFGKRICRLTKNAAKLQQTLGDVHDAAVGYEKLRQLGQIAGSMGDQELIFVSGELAALEIESGRHAHLKWRKSWKKLKRSFR